MSITINGEDITFTTQDDEESVLQKYVIGTLKSLPEYFSIIEEDYTFQDGEELTVKDIRDELRDMTLEELGQESIISSLKRSYPRLSGQEIGILWILENPLSEDELDEIIPLLRKVDQRFANRTITQNQVKDYQRNYQEKFEKAKKEQKEKEEFFEKIDSIQEVESSPYILESITTVQTLKVPIGLSLEDIFDAFDVNEKLPYLVLSREGKLWYKIYSHFTPPLSWVEEPLEDGLHFKILNVDPEKILGRKTITGMYSEGVWFSNNNVEINFSTLGKKKEEIKEILFTSLEDRIDYTIVQERQIQVKGTFSVGNISFNKAVFSDMIQNNNIMNKFLFLNERNGTPLSKDRFVFYYSTSEFDITNSLTITATPRMKEENWIDIRISRASTFHQASTFKNIFSKFLRVYLDNFDSVIEEYKKYLPGAPTLFSKYGKKIKKKTKEDMKTGKRLFNLKSRHPDVFAAGYATLCAQAKQPYILDPSDIENFKEEHGSNKVMEYTDPITGETDTYACEPREGGEEGGFIYPGLRKNDKTGFKEQVPFVPCCYTDDQYSKVGGWLYKQLYSQEKEQDYRNEDRNDVGHVLVAKKKVPRGRLGDIPFYLSLIVQSAGYKEIDRNGKMILPILRYGVMDAPDSFLHCLEKAFNSRYTSMNREERIKTVRNVRERMSEMNFAVAKQELYDYSNSDIAEILLSNDYLDPGYWVRLAEVYYDCNIFLYQRDDEYPNGAVIIPRFSKAYLLRDISESKKSVFIIKTKNEKGGYQCELIVKYSPFRIDFSFDNDPLIEEAISTLYKANTVYKLTPISSEFYTPCFIPDF